MQFTRMSYNKTESNLINNMMCSCSIKAKGLAFLYRVSQYGTVGRETAEVLAELDHSGATFAGLRHGAQYKW